MNDHVTIKCNHCSKNFEWDRLKLAPHWGKRVRLKCKLCKCPNEVNVNAELMAGKTSPGLNANPATEYTIHISPNDKGLQIAKLIVIENEFSKAQSFDLKEGEYIIGRQSDNDAEIPNKIRIVTDDVRMSRSHCQINVVRKADQSYRYILTDLDSLNGTHVETAMGSKKLEKNEKIVVHPGNVVGLGLRTQIRLEL